MDAIEFIISNWKILELMYNIASKSRELNFLPRMKYELLIAPNKSFFITCDSPKTQKDWCLKLKNTIKPMQDSIQAQHGQRMGLMS